MPWPPPPPACGCGTPERNRDVGPGAPAVAFNAAKRNGILAQDAAALHHAQPAAFRAGSICSALVSASFMVFRVFRRGRACPPLSASRRHLTRPGQAQPLRHVRVFRVVQPTLGVVDDVIPNNFQFAGVTYDVLVKILMQRLCPRARHKLVDGNVLIDLNAPTTRPILTRRLVGEGSPSPSCDLPPSRQGYPYVFPIGPQNLPGRLNNGRPCCRRQCL